MGADLDELNGLLAPVEAREIERFDRPTMRPVFVVGAPRSGHTVTSQLLAASGAFGYITNFTSRFWLAPLIGARTQSALGLEDAVDFQSVHGRTGGWSNPHEGGYFLRRFITFSATHVADRPITPGEVAVWRKEIAALEAFHGKPVMLRNVVYGMNMGHVAAAFPDAVIVVCHRSKPAHVASILRSRAEAGDGWWSARPAGYEDWLGLPDEIQAVRQIDGCMNLIDRYRSVMTMIDLDIEKIQEAPRREIAHVLSAADVTGNMAQLPDRL